MASKACLLAGCCHCQYDCGMSLLRRAHNLPLSNKGNWCALVEELASYQHGAESEVTLHGSSKADRAQQNHPRVQSELRSLRSIPMAPVASDPPSDLDLLVVHRSGWIHCLNEIDGEPTSLFNHLKEPCTHQMVCKMFETFSIASEIHSLKEHKICSVRSSCFHISPFSLRGVECGWMPPLHFGRRGFQVSVHLHPSPPSTIADRMQSGTSSTLQ